MAALDFMELALSSASKETTQYKIRIYDTYDFYVTFNGSIWNLTSPASPEIKFADLIDLCKFIFSELLPPQADLRIHIKGFKDPLYIYHGEDVHTSLLNTAIVELSDKSEK